MNTIWFLKNTSSGRILGITECDHHGKPFSLVGWRTKGELIRYLKSYGYYIKDSKILISDNDQWEICSVNV
jgi:hypothetical protein